MKFWKNIRMKIKQKTGGSEKILPETAETGDVTESNNPVTAIPFTVTHTYIYDMTVMKTA